MSKRRWSLCISLLMVAVMSVSILAGTGITVAAEELLMTSENNTQAELPEEPANVPAMGEPEGPAHTERAEVLDLTDEVTPVAGVSAVNLTITPDLLLAGASYTDAVYKNPGNVTVGNCTVESITWSDATGNSLVDENRLEERN